MASKGTKGKLKTRNGKPLELYLIRISPACRAVWFYLLQNNIPHVLIDVDFTKGETTLPDVLLRNSHQEVPLLVDGDYIIFEGPPILNYLAQTYTNHAGFGSNQSTRLATESVISWANSELHRVIGYGYIYPQFLEKYAVPSEHLNDAIVDKGLRHVTQKLEILEGRYLSKNKYLTGKTLTMADIFVATVVAQLQWTGSKSQMWPNVIEWLSRVQKVEFWEEVHASHRQYVQELTGGRILVH
ncbi:glutathione S-transferase theta-1 [Patella vulgata]|uniref:glutathione S-transferase theta-1 n=1 Tax=Patella vulgata TaxID=6465 RepID=UPI00217F83E4|nr:glutathione S-transferase theta-1 [Patella vulgata]